MSIDELNKKCLKELGISFQGLKVMCSCVHEFEDFVVRQAKGGFSPDSYAGLWEQHEA